MNKKTIVEIWYSPKYNEFVLREFAHHGSGMATGFEYADGFNFDLFYRTNGWLYWGQL